MLTLELVDIGSPDARLVATLSGMDVLWCCQSQVSVPLTAVTEVETPAPEASQYLLKGIRVGTHLPGYVAKGNWYWFGTRMFVYLYGTDRADKSIGIGMKRNDNQPFTRWILEVPEGVTASRIDPARMEAEDNRCHLQTVMSVVHGAGRRPPICKYCVLL